MMPLYWYLLEIYHRFQLLESGFSRGYKALLSGILGKLVPQGQWLAAYMKINALIAIFALTARREPSKNSLPFGGVRENTCTNYPDGYIVRTCLCIRGMFSDDEQSGSWC
jgi:hypothetical protein